MTQKNWSVQQRAQMSRLLGAVRWSQTWFKAPPGPKLTASRVAQLFDVPKRFVDCAPGSESSVAWLNRELKRPSSSLNHGTAHFAGKPYHWTQTYDGVLRLAPGESPW